jgi:hypothetical protein
MFHGPWAPFDIKQETCKECVSQCVCALQLQINAEQFVKSTKDEGRTMIDSSPITHGGGN